jgi:hypothetical protein
MRGNGDFEAKCPAIWEFDFMKRRKHGDLFVEASVHSSSGQAWPVHPRLLCCNVAKTWMPGIKPGMTGERQCV